MRLLPNIAAAIYYFTNIWLYGNELPGASDTWQHPSGNRCVAMGLMAADGTPIEKDYAPWRRRLKLR